MATISSSELQTWADGTWLDCFEKLGAHPVSSGGTRFVVWAPGVDRVSVIGDFNGWNPVSNPLKRLGKGISTFWEGVVEEAGVGHRYKYRIEKGDHAADKTDPFAFTMEPAVPGGSAMHGLSSIVTERAFEWTDQAWMSDRDANGGKPREDEAISIYELHLGSWRRRPDGTHYNYDGLAAPLIEYVQQMGFTHVELLPVLEHPFYASWGYQVIGYYCPTSRYGSPAQLKQLIDSLHQAGIGVYLDWVPAHFATDPQGLEYYTGNPLFEYAEPLMQVHPDWGTHIFNYENGGVRSFLTGNVLYWLREFHVDGLRVDAVASMLYRDYSRDEFSVNEYGGKENLEASSLLAQINDAVRDRYPGVVITAEESTTWPNITEPTAHGGLGFQSKWNMGWMNDTLSFMSSFQTVDPSERRQRYREFTFPLAYAFGERYTLPLSHDEVVHGKGSLWGKMPGDDQEKAANLRLMFAHQYGHPGKKLVFSGSEFGQIREWDHDRELDWDLLTDPLHAGIRQWIMELNRLYTHHDALQRESSDSFNWRDISNPEGGTAAYLREAGSDRLLFVFNFLNYNAVSSFPRDGDERFELLVSSSDEAFGGSGESVTQRVDDSRLVFEIPPLTVGIFRGV